MKPARVAPLVVLSSVSMMCVTCAPVTRDLWALFGAFGAAPAIGVAIVSWLLTRSRWTAAVVAYASTLIGSVAIAGVVSRDSQWWPLVVFTSAILSTLAFALAAPFLHACTKQRDGNRLLGIGAAWASAILLLLSVTGFGDARIGVPLAIVAAFVAIARLRRRR
jgi:hypothetical protein